MSAPHVHARDVAQALGDVAASLADGRRVTAADVERFLAAQSTRPAPPAATAAGRQLRRWALQVIVGELLAPLLPGALLPGAADRTVAAAGSAGEAVLPAPSRLRCEVGSIAAAVLIRSPAARRALAALPDADPVLSTVPGSGREIRRRQQFALELQRIVAENVTLGAGWHHPGDARYRESAHSH